MIDLNEASFEAPSPMKQAAIAFAAGLEAHLQARLRARNDLVQLATELGPSSSRKGRWVTIGGRKGDDGKRHGGSPVFVVDGKITKGHPSLLGKRPGAISGPAEHGTHRQQLNQERQYQRSLWVKKARTAGIRPEALHALADDLRSHDKELVRDRVAMLKHARQMLAKGGYDPRALHRNIGTGHVGDAASVKGLDEVGASMAAQYPEQFAGHGDAAERLFDLLGEGNPVAMSEAEAYEQALDVLMNDGASRLTPSGRRAADDDDPVPF